MQGYNNAKIVIKSKFKETDVVTGAEIRLSVEDARALMQITDLTPITDENGTVNEDTVMRNQQVGEKSRFILRKIAKAILYTSGNATNESELLKSLVVEQL